MKHLLVLLLLFAIPAGATTFVVPSDRDLIVNSQAIVIGSAGESRGVFAEGGWIETLTVFHVQEVIRGQLKIGQTIELRELGGVVGEVGYHVEASPRYAPGERVLLFLQPHDRGGWSSKEMALGRFAFQTDRQGRELVVRDAAICGWDANGAPHAEPSRLATRFLNFVRAAAAGETPEIDYIVHDGSPSGSSWKAETTAAASTYLMQGSNGLTMRWPSFPTAVTFFSRGIQTGAVAGGVTAAQRGLAAWTNDNGSNVNYLYGGTTTASFGLNSFDSVNSIQFNDPNNEISGSFTGTGVLAIGGAWFSGGTTHTHGGEQFLSIIAADLVVQDGLVGIGLTGNGFDHVLTHELGHTLGLRHSDEPPAGGTSATGAIMNSTIAFDSDPFGSTLQAWDREALAVVYGISGPVCTPPSITSHPQSTAAQPGGVVLSVGASGSAPLQYQWYVGQTGSTVQAVSGGSTPQISVSPSTTTSYWVRVSNGCNPPANSNTATVTVNGCPAVMIGSTSGDVAILEGKSTMLSVEVVGGNTAMTFQWFRGTTGDTSVPIAGATSPTLAISPTTTSSYWVRVQNSCGALAFSEALTVTVQPCTSPQLLVPPTGGSFTAGDTVTLSATLGGTKPLQIEWTQDGATIPNATAATFTTGPLFAPATFRLTARNDCGEVSSASVSYSLVPICIGPAITEEPADVSVVSGTAAILRVSATGTSLTYAWYEGPFLDFTKPVGGSSPQLYLSAVSSQKQYWVRISNGCGVSSSRTVTVTPIVAKRRGTRS